MTTNQPAVKAVKTSSKAPTKPAVTGTIDTDVLNESADVSDQIRQSLAENAAETQAHQSELEKDLSLVQPTSDATPSEYETIAALRAQLAGMQRQLEDERKRTAMVVATSFRQARPGEDGQNPIAVIDEYGHVHPFTTNNNDRIGLLKMRVQYIYNQEDLQEALKRADKIRNNEADANAQMVGAGLTRFVGVPRVARENVNEQGMVIQNSSLAAINPLQFAVKNDPNRM